MQVDFAAGGATDFWDVYIDHQPVCTTPCSLWIDPSRPILLRTRESSASRSPDEIYVPHLGAHAAAGSLRLEAHRTSQGKLATGITFTTLGGAALITGVTLGAIGCLADRSEGMCTAGQITLAAGAVVTAGAIWLILDSGSRANIMPTYRISFGPNVPGAERAAIVRIGPGFVTGQF